MLDKKVIKRFERYLELSEKFSKSENDLFGESRLQYSNVISGSGNLTFASPVDTLTLNTTAFIGDRELYIDGDGTVKAKDAKGPITRADEIKARAEAEAQIADEYDEYLELRNKLRGILGAYKTLNE